MSFKNNHNLYWARAIVLVDMNCFFAQIEQIDFPELKGQPIAVTNGLVGTGIITCSYEARKYGVKTGIRIKDAKKLCPSLIQRPARPKRYSEVSKLIMKSLEDITPDIEVFSVDEAFLDITFVQKLWGNPEKIGKMIKDKIFQVSGLFCSIGISKDKSTAKLAAKQQKPNGFTMVYPDRVKEFLRDKPVTELCGINTGIGNFLAQYGVYTCGDMQKLPISILSKRFGPLGRKIWLMCQGEDTENLQQTSAEPKSMGHGKIMPPNTKDKNTLITYIRHMCEKLSFRLRKNRMQAQTFLFQLRSHQDMSIKCLITAKAPINDGYILFQLCYEHWMKEWQGQSFFQVHITALDPTIAFIQSDLFEKPDTKRQLINQTIDKINSKFGEFTIAPAPLIHRSSMPNVISPAWKPEGFRQTIEN